LPITSQTSRYAPETLNKYREIEGDMIASDKLINETLEKKKKKNNLESYIYEMRSKCEDSHKDFVSEKVKEEFLQSLSDTENWLYDEGETATKSVFIEKLTNLQKIGSPIENRFREAEGRPFSISELRKTIAYYKEFVKTIDPKYEHVDASDRAKITEEVEKKKKFGLIKQLPNLKNFQKIRTQKF